MVRRNRNGMSALFPFRSEGLFAEIIGDEVVMAAQDDGMTLWRLGNVIQGSIVFSPYGWSDFCPLKEVALCRIPEFTTRV